MGLSFFSKENLIIPEPFAKFGIRHDIGAAKVMLCRLWHKPQKAQKSQNEFSSQAGPITQAPDTILFLIV